MSTTTIHTHRGVEYQHRAGEDNGFGQAYSVWKFTSNSRGIDVILISQIFQSEAEIMAAIDGRIASREAEQAERAAEPTITARPTIATCRCDGEADNRGRCYQCGGYQRGADAGRFF